MIRQSLSPASRALIKELSPGPEAPIHRCRSMNWMFQDSAGERIHIEFGLENARQRRRAKRIAVKASALALSFSGAMLASLAVMLSEKSILFDALVLWP